MKRVIDHKEFNIVNGVIRPKRVLVGNDEWFVFPCGFVSQEKHDVESCIRTQGAKDFKNFCPRKHEIFFDVLVTSCKAIER